MSVHKLPAETNSLEQAQARGRDTKADLSTDPPPSSSGSSSETGEDDDDDWNDWAEDDSASKICISLFDDTKHEGLQAAIVYDKEKHGFDIRDFSEALRLDFYARVRLVNFLRRKRPLPSDVKAYTSKEAFLSDDSYLIPVVQDDPYLQFGGEAWSDDEDAGEDAGADARGKDRELTSEEKDREVQRLRRKLEQAQRDLVDFRQLVEKQFKSSEISAARDDELSVAQPSTTTELAPKRDDDTHYFNSYGDNEIHYVMLKDRVRTATYASFIMNSPDLFTDAVVLDVGCGTGILSLLAARAGARRVIAVDASEDIAQKARKIVEMNELQDVITVINGKVEDIELPDGITQVDVIVSEWMGYALLYESMLDSVLVARDRFLKPCVNPEMSRGREEKDLLESESSNGGVLAPSQTRMLLGLCSAHEVVKDRIEFWSDVYGFDMTPMTDGVYDEAVMDVVPGDSMLTESVIIKDIDTAKVTLRELSFSSPFTLYGTSARRTVAHAFILYFDAFFTPDGSQVSQNTRATVAGGDGTNENAVPVVAEVWRPGSPSRARSPSVGAQSDSGMDRASSPTRREKMRRRQSSVKLRRAQAKGQSFTTGPESEPTHWKQTLFLLKEPIVIQEGCEISGTFHCRKSGDNSRELDVELHYVVRRPDKENKLADDSPMIVQSFKVR